MDKNLLLIKILKYCKAKRDILDKQADAGFSTDVDVGRAYELSRIIEIIEGEVKLSE